MTPPARWLSALLVFAAAFGVYSNTFNDGFVWDDHVQVESNAFLRDPRNVRKILNPAFLEKVLPVRGGGRPLVLLSLTADHALWGDEAGGYHLTNVLLHGAASVAFYALALECLAAWPALFAALLFAVHPIHTEAIGVISFRGDLLAAFFMFAGLWAYVRLSSRKGWVALAFGILTLQGCYLAGLMAKEMVLSLPGLALLFEWVFRRPKKEGTAYRRAFWLRQALVLLLPAALAVGYLIFRAPRAGFPPALASGLIPSVAQWDIVYRDPFVNFRTMSWVFSQYFSLMLFPYPLEIDRAPLLIQRWLDGWLWSSWLVLGLLVWIAILCGRRRKHLAVSFGLGWCFLSLIPVSNLVPIYNVMAERYLYVVSAGVCLAIAALLDGVSVRIAAASAAVLIFGAYSGIAFARNRAYFDDRSLYMDETRRFVDSARLHCNRGLFLQREGQITAAVEEFRKALALHPRYAEAKIALGNAFETLGMREEALESYKEGAALQPRYAVPYYLLAEALRNGHQLDAAKRQYMRAIDLDPRLAAAHLGLGLCALEAHQTKEALGELRTAQKMEPDLASADFALGELFASQKRWGDAAEEFKWAWTLDPWDGDLEVRLAQCYRKMGRIAAAKRWMARAKARG